MKQILFVLFSAAVLDAQGLTCGSTAKPANLKAQIIFDLERDFCLATQAKRLDGWMSYFADDAVIFPRKLSHLKGKDNLREYYTQVFANPNSTLIWRPTDAEISSSGDLGYAYGIWESKGKDKDGTASRSTGKYTTIWKKQKDGSWKVMIDIGNPDE